MDARLKCPFNMQVCGPSQSGKSSFVLQLLKYQTELLEEPTSKVCWYSPHNFSSPELPFIESFQKLPWEIDEEDEDDNEREVEGLQSGGQRTHRIIVLDDFGLETRDSKQLTNYFTKFSHHKNVSIIQVLQNMFWSGGGGSEGRTRSLNTHYMVLMKQSRDQRQIRTLARQISQNNTQFNSFLEAYNAATSQRNYAYLLVSLHPRDHADLLLRANIFPTEAQHTSVYLIRKKV